MKEPSKPSTVIGERSAEDQAADHAREIYPMANIDDYPDNPNVNRLNNACRSAFMNGFRYASQFKPKSSTLQEPVYSKEDMGECWQASREHIFYLKDPAQTKYYPNFKEWLKSYTRKPE